MIEPKKRHSSKRRCRRATGFHLVAFAVCTAFFTLVTVIECSRDDSPKTDGVSSAASPDTDNAVAKPPSERQSSSPSVEGTWVSVRREDLRKLTPAIGTFRARQVTRVGPQVSGRVKDVLVDVGDVVHEGDDLVRLDPVFFQIEVEQRRADVEAARAKVETSKQAVATAQAEVEVARSILADADLNLDRMKKLWEKPDGETPSIPKSRYDDAVFRHRQSAAGLEAAQSRLSEDRARRTQESARLRQTEEALRYSQQRLKETVILAPYDAVVTERLVDPGEPVSTNPPSHVLELQEIRVLELEFSLPQPLLAVVHAGTPVEFEVEGVGGNEVSGRVAVVYPDIDEQTRSFRCRVLIDNEELRYRPGLLATVRVVESKARNALAVPASALHRDQDGWYVLASNDEHPVRQAVDVGMTTDGKAEIKAGLHDDMKVLVPTGADSIAGRNEP